MTRILVVALCLLAACKSQSRVDPSEAPTETPSPIVYGELHRVEGSVVPLSQIVADPSTYEGREVLTEGEVQRVCQKRGCWLELADASGARAFVPMAGHRFAVPTETVGQRVLVEGTVHLRERSEAERKHLESDGAGSSIPTVSIEANGVLIR